MAVDAIIALDADVWTELTNADATSITVIHEDGARVKLRATVGAVPPSAGEAGGLPISSFRFRDQTGFLKKALAEMTHTASPTRVYGRAIGGAATVYVETD